MATIRSKQSGPSRPTPPRNPRGGGGGGNGRGPRKGRPQWLRRLIIVVQLTFVLIGIAIVSLLGLIFWLYGTLPSAESQIKSYRPPGRAMIYSSDGVLLADLFQQNRKVITIDQMPVNLQKATVDVEDRRFYSNVGVDLRGIGRALVRDFTHRRSKEGASTITQQLVRNIGIGGVGREKTIARKIKEALYAIQIERNYSKQQILEMYLNQVYYGSGAYGVESAAETYFNKSADKLSLPECAMLAGLPRAPTLYSPYVDKEAARVRRDLVLSKMLEQGDIGYTQYSDAIATPIALGFTRSPQGRSHVYHAPYFVDYVVKQLSEKFGSDFIYRGGINIATTINWQVQDQAEKALENGVEDARWRGASQAALVAIDPHTGFIRAMVGGVDYSKSQFNIAADGRRQAGSSFKPIIYTAAIDSGLINQNTRILDAPVSYPGLTGVWSPKNDDHRFRGWVTAKRALALSINIAAVKVLKLVGPDTAIRYANMMGIKSPLAPYLTLALGASAVTPIEMAVAYSVIDTGGERPSPLSVKQITDTQGAILYSADPQVETTSIGKDALSQVKEMMRAVVTEGTASAILGDGSVAGACGKTGTTQSHYDVWFDGFTDDLVCTVWAGHPSKDARGRAIYGVPMNGEAFGATICAPIWKRFMIAAEPILAKERVKEAPPKAHPAPPPIETDDDATGTDSSSATPSSTGTSDGTQVTVWVDNVTGQRVAAKSPNSHTVNYARGTEPPLPSTPSTTDTQSQGDSTQTNAKPPAQDDSKPHTVTVTICTDSGQLATQWCPSTLTRTYVAGQEPKKYCTIHQPPPGEH
ncbi:MAG: PBP1A family penicillin-binding protein [Capsulimonadaceae bacterium]|nr:PBP1A family penicillin-binding protein [Capsulimonadaceae bacterium]